MSKPVFFRLIGSYLTAAAVLVVSGLGAAQTDAPSDAVAIPGTEISGWGHVDEVPARFGRPSRSTAKMPAQPSSLTGSDICASLAR